MSNEEFLIDYLTQMSDMMKEMKSDIMSMYEYVLKNGRLWTPGPLPRGTREGQMRVCYANSQKLARRMGYRYVEGFAFGACVVPMQHAWCVTSDDFVVDVTPPWTVHDCVYFGVPFDISEVDEMISGNEFSISVIDNWEKGFPLLRSMGNLRDSSEEAEG